MFGFVELFKHFLLQSTANVWKCIAAAATAAVAVAVAKERKTCMHCTAQDKCSIKMQNNLLTRINTYGLCVCTVKAKTIILFIFTLDLNNNNAQYCHMNVCMCLCGWQKHWFCTK